VSSRVRMYGRHKMMQVSIRAGRPGFEKAIIAALPGVPQEMSMSYLLCRSKGARDIVSGAQSVQVKGLDVDAPQPPSLPLHVAAHSDAARICRTNTAHSD
jgi:hypothetical protein